MVQKQIFELDPLFADVQMQQVFADGKTFVDCIPKQNTEVILQQYLAQKNEPGFNLASFVAQHFEQPKVFAADYTTAAGSTASEHINTLWDILTREPDQQNGSLIPLPFAYIVPGGRFGEVYYWDSYFTMLGLKASGRTGMIENMVNNFSHLIETMGFIPNGNRTYYAGRSQPPFYSLMVQLLAQVRGKQTLQGYLDTLQKEYRYWMQGADTLAANNNAIQHIVKMKDGELMNRYYDVFDTARPESYREDVELAHQSAQEEKVLYRHLRAGAESGWDYSSRWFADGQSFSTIHTTDIVPVDLNCLLWHLEHTIAEALEIAGQQNESNRYKILAEQRKQAIEKYCWSEADGFYTDYDYKAVKQTGEISLAGLMPLFFHITSQPQADLVAETVQAKFCKPGGAVTSFKNTGQQWDAPNGWAPLQWITIIGLQNYHHHSLAETIAKRWLALNDKVFAATGKMMEKYNVEDISQLAGGGEYPGQDGFGWTNGVYLALKQMFAKAT